MKDNVPSYADVENIKEVDESLSIFKKNSWPIIDVIGSRLKRQHQL